VGRVVGYIEKVEHNWGRGCDRVSLVGWRSVLMRPEDTALIAANYGVDAPPVEFEFEVGRLGSRVQRFAPTGAVRPSGWDPGLAHMGLRASRDLLLEQGQWRWDHHSDLMEEWLNSCPAEGPDPVHYIVGCLNVPGHSGPHSGHCFECYDTSAGFGHADPATLMHPGLARAREKRVAGGYAEQLDYERRFPTWRAEFCFEEGESSDHGTVYCQFPRSHVGPHRHQCFACVWTVHFLTEAQRLDVRLR